MSLSQGGLRIYWKETHSSIKKKQMSPWNFNDFDAVDKIYDHHKIFSSERSKFYLERFLE